MKRKATDNLYRFPVIFYKVKNEEKSMQKM